MAQRGFRTRLLVLALLWCGLSGVPRACDVPVFRYALERWPADLYQVVVYYETAPPREEFELLEKSAAGQTRVANYSLKAIDVTKPNGKTVAAQRKIAAFPWVEIYYPANSEVRGPVWSGPLTSVRVRQILESRGRSRLAKKLLSGEVAVWVLIRSGHEGKDRRALDALTSSLALASATLRIPEVGTDLAGEPIAVKDFKTYPVHFDLMDIARNDSDEAFLVSALLKSEPDLQKYDEPMAFPVFGRGRALYALVGDGIQESTILEACQSLVNWCSCEIKALNPGTDLLISADWSRPFGGKMVKDPELPLTGLRGFVPGPTTPATGGADAKANSVMATSPACDVRPAAGGAAPVTEPAPTPGTHRPLWRNLLYTAGGAGIVIMALSVLVTLKRKNRV